MYNSIRGKENSFVGMSVRYNSFLRNHVASQELPYTHTRMERPGGKYHFGSQSDLEKFYDYYYSYVFDEGNKESMVEKQQPIGALFIDLDFRIETPERPYTKEHVAQFCSLVMQELNEMFVSLPEVEIFVMEKTAVNSLDPTNLKDGLHFLFCVAMDVIAKQILRARLLDRIDVIWADIFERFTNSKEQIIDHRVMNHAASWMLYGSSKTDQPPYLVTDHYTCRKGHDGEDVLLQCPIPTLSRDSFVKYTAHYEHPVLDNFSPAAQREYDSIKEREVRRNRPVVPHVRQNRGGSGGEVQIPSSQEEMDEILRGLFPAANPVMTFEKELLMMLMRLPEKYFGPNTYDDWVRVGFACKNTAMTSPPGTTSASRIFMCFLKFCSRKEGFDWSKDPQEILQMWNSWNTPTEEAKRYTYKSISYWLRISNPAGYLEYQKQTETFYVDQIVQSPVTTDVDVASLMYHLYGHRFVCSSTKHNTWYEFLGQRWVPMETGRTLYNLISAEDGIQGIFHRMSSNLHGNQDAEEQTKRLSKIMIDLKLTPKKKNIMVEAGYLFYIKDFVEKLDDDPYTLCCENGVVVLPRQHGTVDQPIFRQAEPLDFLSKSTLIDYIPWEEHDPVVREEMMTYLRQILPVDESFRFVMNFLSSALYGEVTNHIFVFLKGIGRNGKSELMKFMKFVFGNYFCLAPVSLITSERPKSGATNSELANLKGIRFVQLSEPSTNEVIQEGPFKALTGGDDITTRQLYGLSFTYRPTAKFCIPLNDWMKFRVTDKGTWRRPRVVDFPSRFTETPSSDPTKFQFLVDTAISAKYPKWAPVMLSFLVEIAKDNRGRLPEEASITRATELYQQYTDRFAEFVNSCIKESLDDCILQKELTEAYRVWWHERYSGAPLGKTIQDELTEYFDKQYGIRTYGEDRKAKWIGIRLLDQRPLDPRDEAGPQGAQHRGAYEEI